MSQYGAPETIALRVQTYREANRRLTIACGALSLVTVIAIAVSATVLLSRPEPRYFATQQNGQILPLVALDAPYLAPNQVTSFAVEAITRSFTFSFSNYRTDLQDASRYYVQPTGWNLFLDALQQSGNLELVQNKRMNATAVAQSATITKEGVAEDGRYHWIVQVPVRVTYESASEVANQNMMVSAEIVRVPTYENVYGVAVFRVVARPN